jgi:biotin carboxyl carrier protein
MNRKNDSDLYIRLDSSLKEESNPFSSGKHGISGNVDDGLFSDCRAAHLGWQLGADLLEFIVRPGVKAGIFDFKMKDDLSLEIPKAFLDEENRKEYFRYLSPPPSASSDTIVAVSGGMFYSRETPDAPRYLEVGQHFEEGDSLYIIEVMKMFNKVYAEFAGTVEEILLDGDTGVIVKKGDPLYRVKPDVEIRIESEEERLERVRKNSQELVGIIFK